LPTNSTTSPEDNHTSKYLDLFKIGAQELAFQITLGDLQLFSDFKPFEFLLASQQPNLPSRIAEFTTKFNRLSQWVTRCIVFQEELDSRVATLGLFISVASALLVLKNFHSFMAVVAGLHQTPVSRLARTWKALPTRFTTEFEKMKQLTSLTNNKAQLRREIEKSQPPYIPFTGILLGDLAALNELPTTVNDQVNFIKCQAVAKILESFLASLPQRAATSYPAINQELQAALNGESEDCSDELYAQSVKLEAITPRLYKKSKRCSKSPDLI